MRLDLEKRQFELADVLRAVNEPTGQQRLTATHVHNWLRAGIPLAPSKHSKEQRDAAPGQKRRRLYSGTEVVMIAGLFHLASVGLTPMGSMHALSVFREQISARTTGKKDKRRVRLIIGPHNAFEVTHDDRDDEETIANALKTLTAYICVNVDLIIDTTMSELQKIVDSWRLTRLKA